MSFRCENCKVAQPAGTKINKVVSEVRRVKYPQVKSKDGSVRIPEGFETVKELDLCPICAAVGVGVSVVGSKELKSKEEMYSVL